MAAERVRAERSRTAARSSGKEEDRGPGTLQPMLRLQRSVGNRAVLGLMAAQAKLTVGAVDDPLEVEADHVADTVVRALRSPVPAGSACPDGVGTADEVVARAVQRLSSVRAVGPEGGEIDPELERTVDAARGGGQAVPDGIRTRMEAVTGVDFSSVRLHQGPQASGLSERLGAEAFTVGGDVFFRSGLPDTSSAAGQRLLAHELAHTVQQGASVRRAASIQRVAEEEGAEGEEEEAGAAETEIGGTLPEITSSTPVPSTAPPPGVVADGRAAAAPGRTGTPGRSPRSTAGGGRKGLSLSVALDLADRETPTQPAVAHATEDKVDPSLKVKTSVAGGMTVTPFGAMGPEISVTNVGYRAKTKRNGNGSVTVKGTVGFDCQWGTNSGGNVDIPSASAAAVTADTWREIADDLTPRKVEKSWVADRRKYYADHLTSRHEKFHAADARGWARGQGIKFFRSYLEKKTVDVSEDDRTDEDKLGQKMRPILQDGYNAFVQAYVTYMNGTGLTYYSYPCEEKAFGDGRKPYQALADAVEKRGKSLEKKAAKQSKKTGADTAN